MNTIIDEDIDTTILAEWEEEVAPPCELTNFPFPSCGPAPAEWALVACCPSCGNGGIRLACTRCKDIRLRAGPNFSVDCRACGVIVQPPRLFYVRVEKL